MNIPFIINSLSDLWVKGARPELGRRVGNAASADHLRGAPFLRTSAVLAEFRYRRSGARAFFNPRMATRYAQIAKRPRFLPVRGTEPYNQPDFCDLRRPLSR